MTKHINNTEWDAPYFIGDLSDFMIEIYYGYSIKGRDCGGSTVENDQTFL